MIVVSGASGFVGRRLAVKLKSIYPNEKMVFLVYDVPNPHDEAGIDFLKRHNVEFHFVNLVSSRGLDRLPKKPRLLFSIAAATDTSKNDHLCNTIGLTNLLNAVEADENTHIIHTSTVAVLDYRSDYSVPIDETTPILRQPGTVYGQSKLEGEDILKAYCHRHASKLTMFRLVTVYGGMSRPNSLFYVLEDMAKRNAFASRLNWPGFTDLIHVDDVVEALILSSDRQKSEEQFRYYILTAESFTFQQICQKVYDGLGISYRPIHLPRTFWKLCALSCRILLAFRPVIPSKIYNVVWRASLIIDNVIWCKGTNFRKDYPQFQVKKFENHFHDVLSHAR